MDTKFQKKHESDMTKKEKRELERAKLASMDGKEKAEYIFAYYKLHIAVLIGMIVFSIGIGVWVDNLQNETILYAAVVNGTELDTAVMEEFRALREDTERRNKYILDTSIVISDQAGFAELEYASRMKLKTLVGGETADIYICPEELYQEYSGQDGILIPVEQLMGREFVESHREICRKDAVQVENSQVLEQYGYQKNGAAYLVVFSYAKHQDAAADFIRFLVDGKLE
ncbi:MAG: hypothetical protein HFH41_02475 [Lachnospiraceae bacterium]|nr:hypothetical protein [Lachnospiraceae bacterium]